jgi:hypothetical protein
VSSALASIITKDAITHLDANQSSVTFGRSADNPVRIGHTPQLDALVSRRAGEIAWLDGRLMVTNHAERLNLTIRVPGRPQVDVYPGDRFAALSSEFDVLLEATFRHVMRCRVLAEGPAVTGPALPPGDDPVTCISLPRLSQRQLRMLDLYAEPIRQGGTTARSHQQVAEILNVSRSLVRMEMNAVWDEFECAGVPMRLFDDKRDEVVDAWLRHRLHPC